MIDILISAKIILLNKKHGSLQEIKTKFVYSLTIKF